MESPVRAAADFLSITSASAGISWRGRNPIALITLGRMATTSLATYQCRFRRYYAYCLLARVDATALYLTQMQ
jgi:hypothetical protein